MIGLRCTIIFLLLTLFVRPQAVLEFENVKDSTNIFRIPLGQFPVQIKFKDSVAFKAVINSFYDSILKIHVYEPSSAIDTMVNRLKNEHNKTLSQQKRKRKFRDSLNKELDRKIMAIKYSTIKDLQISRIKTITIYNRYFPEKKKQIKLANAAAILFLGATFASASTQNPYYIGAGIGLTAISFMAKSALSTRDLDLIIPKRAKKRKQWRIKGVKDL